MGDDGAHGERCSEDSPAAPHMHSVWQPLMLMGECDLAGEEGVAAPVV